MKNKVWFLTVVACSFLSQTHAQIVSTFAGNTSGYTNGIGSDAQFNNPETICIDSAGNLFLADAGNHVIRKITPDAVVTTFAGSSVAGFADGLGTNASFYAPTGIAIDAANNLYVADTYNNKIRKIDPSGQVTTIAGSSVGYQDGLGSDAKFYNPMGIGVAADGTVYIADTLNNRIRKITTSGAVSTLVGSVAGSTDGPVATALIYQPIGLCFDLVGNLLVCDAGNAKIRKITPAGEVTTFAGSTIGYLDGLGTAAKFRGVRQLYCAADGNFYLAEYTNNKIRKISPTGEVTTYAGASTSEGIANGPALLAGFYWPAGITMDQFGNIFVSEHGASKIRKITAPLVTNSFEDSATNLVVWSDAKAGKLYINVDHYETSMQLLVTDLNGKAMYNSPLTTDKSILDATHYSAGIYLVTVSNGKNKTTKKITIR